MTWLAVLALIAAPPVSQPTAGTITVEPTRGDVTGTDSDIFRDAVASALAGVEFTPLPPPGYGRYLAEVTVTRTQRGEVAAASRRAGTTPLMGGWGAAVVVPLGRNGKRIAPLMVTELKVRVLRRVGRVEVWSARALTAQPLGSEGDEPWTVAAKLADAIAAVFPQQGSQPISVP